MNVDGGSNRRNKAPFPNSSSDVYCVCDGPNSIHVVSCTGDRLRTFARKFSNIDFFLKMLPLKDVELVMSEM